jgi:5-(carboxyamino)imidazole ribonucleotide mutase
MNAAILAVQMMATGDEELMQKLVTYKQKLKQKIVQANKDLSEVKYKFKTN